MDTLATSNGWATAPDGEAVTVPRRQATAIALLVCVPVPLFSLGTTVVPLPQILERAAASFVSLAAPSARNEGLTRETRRAEGLEIVYAPDEQHPVTTRATMPERRAAETTASRGPRPKRAKAHPEPRELRSQPLPTGEGAPSTATPDQPAPPDEPAVAPDPNVDRPAGGGSAAGGGGGQPSTGGQQGGDTASGPGGGSGGGQGSGSAGHPGSSSGSSGGAASPPEPPGAGNPGSGAVGGGRGSDPADPPASAPAQPPEGKGRP